MVHDPTHLLTFAPRLGLASLSSTTMAQPGSSHSFTHQQKKHEHLMRLPCVLTPETSSLSPVRPVPSEFSCNVRTLPVRPESVPHASTPLLRPELRSNHPLHPDLTSPLFSISSVLTLSIRQLVPEAFRIIRPLPLVSWRELCTNPTPALGPPKSCGVSQA